MAIKIRVKTFARRVLQSDEHDVLCIRPGPWGNPFKIGPASRDEVVGMHRVWLWQRPPEWLDRLRRELSGKRLACVCDLDQRCHVDNLVEFLNGD